MQLSHCLWGISRTLDRKHYSSCVSLNWALAKQANRLSVSPGLVPPSREEAFSCAADFGSFRVSIQPRTPCCLPFNLAKLSSVQGLAHILFTPRFIAGLGCQILGTRWKPAEDQTSTPRYQDPRKPLLVYMTTTTMMRSENTPHPHRTTSGEGAHPLLDEAQVHEQRSTLDPITSSSSFPLGLTCASSGPVSVSLTSRAHPHRHQNQAGSIRKRASSSALSSTSSSSLETLRKTMFRDAGVTPAQRISRAKKGKRVHACDHQGCEKVFLHGDDSKESSGGHWLI